MAPTEAISVALTATARLSDAGLRVIGYVVPALANGDTSVSVQFNGEPVKATPPDATGRFVLYPVPPGTYDLVVTAPGRVTAVMTGVPVLTTAYTYVNSAAVPIAPAPATAASTPRAVTGTVRAIRSGQAARRRAKAFTPRRPERSAA